jgi:hypothetical protein
MASEAIAKRLFKSARKLYERGLKSHNKMYGVDAEGDTDPRVHVSWWKRLTGSAAARNRVRESADRLLDEFGRLRAVRPRASSPGGRVWGCR